MKKNYSITKIRAALKNFKYEEMGYPEFTESGKCTWNFDCWNDISDRDLEKLITEQLVVYFMLEGRYVPATILDEHSQKWRI